MQSRMARLRADAQRLEQRAQVERERHRSLDALFDVAERDGEVGGGIIAGALAFRLFIWMLPLALVVVAGLGIAAHAIPESPAETAGEVGLGGLISDSIANAADSPNRWYALLVGIPLLVWATRSLLRVLIGAHRLVWTDARTRAPKPTLSSALVLLGLILGFAVVATAASAARKESVGFGAAATLLALVPYAGLWLLVSARLPHRDTPWRALIPGAIVLAVGIELFQAAIVYVITPYAIAKQGTYGALGVASVLLVGFFAISRLMVTAAILNAALWERAH